MKNKFYIITFILIIVTVESYAQHFSENGAIPIQIIDVRDTVVNLDTSLTDKQDGELRIFRADKYEIHIYKILGNELKHYHVDIKTSIAYNKASYRWLGDSWVIFWMHSNDTPHVLTQKLILEGDKVMVDLSK